MRRSLIRNDNKMRANADGFPKTTRMMAESDGGKELLDSGSNGNAAAVKPAFRHLPASDMKGPRDERRGCSGQRPAHHW